MGRMRIDSKAEASINHFSHPHPLHLCNHHPNQTLTLPSCSSCNLTASGLIYICKPCNYFLHIKCAQIPNQIKHPSHHQHHILSLLSKPISPRGFFNCIACGKQGHGFSYHCKPCNIHIHTFCATMPLSLTHQSHRHELRLLFSPPYPNKRFCCDVCKNHGSDHWLYRCNSCQFDVHLNCTTVQSPMPQILQTQQPSMQNFTPNLTNQSSGYGFSMPNGTIQSNDMLNPMIQRLQAQQSQAANLQALQGITATGSSQNYHQLMNQIHNMQAQSQANDQQVLQGLMGSSQNYQQLMNQMIQNNQAQSQAASQIALQQLMASAGGGQNLQNIFTGGGGGGQDYLQAFMGGGGGGQEYLQALMGGGGGGQEYLQALMGGGGGGQEYLQALMGGGGGGQEYLQALMGGGGGGQEYLQALMGGGGIGSLGGLGGGDGGSFSFLDILSGLGGVLGGF